MCVSAEASFGLTGLLTPVGIYCAGVAWNRDKTFLAVSTIPLAFGIQQFCEGMVWVGIGRGDVELTRTASLGFLFFAFAYWLFWIPLSSIFLEPRRKIKWILMADTLAGLAAGMIFYWPVIRNPNVLVTSVMHHSIQYNIDRPPWFHSVPLIVWHLTYLTVIGLPLALAPQKKELGFCIVLTLMAVISHQVFWYAFASVWCFLAAILSLYLAYVFYKLPTRQNNPTYSLSRERSAAAAQPYSQRS